MQLHPIDTEASPPYPRTCGEARALRNLPGVQDRKQSRVDEQRLWIPDYLGEDFAAHRLHSKRLIFLIRRCNEEGCNPTTPGNRCEKNLSASRKKERSLSTPRSCWKSAKVMTSESESRLRDS